MSSVPNNLLLNSPQKSQDLSDVVSRCRGDCVKGSGEKRPKAPKGHSRDYPIHPAALCIQLGF